MTLGLEGLKIVNTRASTVSKAFSDEVKCLGGRVIEAPLMTFQPLPQDQSSKAILQQMECFDWIVFTSGNGVRFFMKHIQSLNLSLSHHLRYAVVGSKTAEALKGFGLKPDIIPNHFTATDLAKVMRKKAKGRVLLSLGKMAKSEFEKTLQANGFETYRLNVYDTICNKRIQPKLKQIIETNEVDVLAFASPSAVRFFCELTKDWECSHFWQRVTIACIGQVTADEVVNQGLTPGIVPNKYTTGALIQSIIHHYH